MKKEQQINYILTASVILLACVLTVCLLLRSRGGISLRYSEDGIAVPVESEEASPLPSQTAVFCGSYVHSISSKKLHREDCHFAERISEENKIILSKEEAERLIGFELCSSCLAEKHEFFVEAAPPPEGAQTEELYIRSRNSDTVHRADCSYAKRIKEENRIYLSEAELEGGLLCEGCFGENG